MATAKRLPSGSYRCQVYDYTDTNGKRHYKSFTAPTKKKAEFLAADYILNKTSIQQSADSMLFSVAVEKYILSRESILSPATIREYRRMQKSKLKPLDDLDLYAINQEDVQSFINKLSQDLSPKSVRCIHGFIAAVIKHSRPSFALNTVMPKKVRPKIYVPSDTEIQRLITHVKNTDMELPVLLAAFGGMRRGEICAFTKEDILKTSLHINKTMVKDSNKNWIIKAPKSYAGDRIVELPEYVMKRIHPVALDPEQLTKKFAHILKNAALPHFRFHDLRHYYASSCHALGIPDQYIMKNGGWGNDGVLKSVYRHTMEQEERKVNHIATSHFDKLCNTKCNT